MLQRLDPPKSRNVGAGTGDVAFTVWRGPPPKQPRRSLKPFLHCWLQARIAKNTVTHRRRNKIHCRTCIAALQDTVTPQRHLISALDIVLSNPSHLLSECWGFSTKGEVVSAINSMKQRCIALKSTDFISEKNFSNLLNNLSFYTAYIRYENAVTRA